MFHTQYFKKIVNLITHTFSTWNLMSAYYYQGIQQWKGEELKKSLNIWLIIYHLHSTTLTKPWKTVTCCHFCVVFLQVYFEFWNSSGPFEEYIPDFMKSSRCVQDECAHMITETTSLLSHIRSCQYLPNINTAERMEQLQKLYPDLMPILDNYFNTNIWAWFYSDVCLSE